MDWQEGLRLLLWAICTIYGSKATVASHNIENFLSTSCLPSALL